METIFFRTIKVNKANKSMTVTGNAFQVGGHVILFLLCSFCHYCGWSISSEELDQLRCLDHDLENFPVFFETQKTA